MKTFPMIVVSSLLVLAVAGCGSNSSNSAPSTSKDVAAFKGNPKDPNLQKALQAHFGGGAPPPPPAAAGK